MATCGHTNQQHFFNGTLDPLTCTLEAGHDGNHHGWMRVLRRPILNPSRYDPAELINIDGLDYLVELDPAYWDDASGLPLG